jgi:murein DD-endopeptidase MepM/ murein hydrolase activator NlpD
MKWFPGVESWRKTVAGGRRSASVIGLAVGGLLAGWAIARTMRGQGAASPMMAEAAREASAVVVTTGALGRGGTLAGLLEEVSVPRVEQAALARELARIFDPRRLRAEDRYRVVRSTGGAMREIVLTQGLTEYAVSRSSAGAYAATERDVPLTAVEGRAAGVLNDSLWLSMSGQGMDADLIADFADVFAWEIDFNVEPRTGDRFALSWEDRKTPDGRVAERRILAALYDGRQTGRQTAILFEGDHYDEDGRSHYRKFLKAPLAFRRITSRFTLHRFHPILRIFRPHLGIDYAAPRGTPIMSVGDGTVSMKGWKTAYGNYLEIRHNSVYTTCYGHMSRYAKGIHPGQAVKQGQVVGYVGATGWATGPHLDFRVRKNGAMVNFLTLKLPPEKNIPSGKLSEFKILAARRLQELSETLKPAGGPPGAAASPHREGDRKN